MFPEHLIFLISDDIKEDHLCRCQISEREKQDSLGMKLVVKYKGPIMGKLGPGKHVLLVCQNLNLLGNKATVNLSVADTYRFTQKYRLFGEVRHESVIRIINFYAIFPFLVLLIMICLNKQAE